MNYYKYLETKWSKKQIKELISIINSFKHPKLNKFILILKANFEKFKKMWKCLEYFVY